MIEISEKAGLAMERMKAFLWHNRFFLAAVATVLFLNIQFDFYYIKTGSMEPELPVGTVVVIDADKKADVGDVYAYQSGRNIVIHRIIAVDAQGYTFKGDANFSADAVKVAEDKLVGEVVLKIRFLALALRWFGVT